MVTEEKEYRLPFGSRKRNAECGHCKCVRPLLDVRHEILNLEVTTCTKCGWFTSDGREWKEPVRIDPDKVLAAWQNKVKKEEQ